jgi:hypothetical protein
VVISFIALLISFIVLGVTYPKGGAKEGIMLGLSETRIVPINSRWFNAFEGSEVTLLDNITAQFLHLLVFNQLPPLTVTDSWNATTNLEIGTTNYQYFSWFFYTGSKLDLQWNFTHEKASLYLIKSAKGFTAFTEWVEIVDDSLIDPYLMNNVTTSSSSYSLTVEKGKFSLFLPSFLLLSLSISLPFPSPFPFP